MIDHIGINVTSQPRSRDFYEKALAPLGYTVVMEVPDESSGQIRATGFGIAPKPDFWIAEGPPGNFLHVAFRAESRQQVDAFHAAALAAGGTDHGGPGLRPHYHPHYYGAFVLDPDGYNIEAVCHTPQ